MIKFTVLLFAGWLIAGCEKERASSLPNEPGVSKRYLALGDSYTIGEAVPETERFPYFIAKWLRDAQIRIGEPEYIATTGWTTSNLIKAIADRNPKGPYDIVTLLIGVNDQFQRMDTAGYRVRFKQLLNTAISLTGNRSNRVFVLSIPDYSATPFVPNSEKDRVSNEIDTFNKINRMVTLENNVSYTDITASTKFAISDPSLLAIDRLHYSAKEHINWAALLTPKIIAVL
jgi:lysophospholipase L1-like esterase